MLNDICIKMYNKIAAADEWVSEWYLTNNSLVLKSFLEWINSREHAASIHVVDLVD